MVVPRKKRRLSPGTWDRVVGPPKGPRGGGGVTSVTAPRPHDLSDSHPLSLGARDPHYSTALPPGPCPHGQTPLLLGPLGGQREAVQAEARHPQGLSRDALCFWKYTCAKIGVPDRTASGGWPKHP